MHHRILLFLALAATISAQNYTINTVAGSPSLVGRPATGLGLGNPVGVAVDSSGNVYFVDVGYSRVFEISPSGTILRQIGTGTSGFGGDGGPANEAYLNSPTAVTVDLVGNVYIADAGNRRVRRVDAGTGTITTIAGNGTYTSSGDGGPAINAGFGSLGGGIATDSAGNIYLGDIGRIRKVTLSTGIISTIAGTGTQGYSGDGGSALAAQIWPTGIGIDSTGNIYFTNGASPPAYIRKIAAGGATVSTLRSLYALSSPAGLSVDASGNIYVAENTNLGVNSSTYIPQGSVTKTAANGTLLGASRGALPCSFYIQGAAVDSAGNTYFADNLYIQKNGCNVAQAIAGRGFYTDYESGTLLFPAGLATDPVGSLFIGDSGHGSIYGGSTVLDFPVSVNNFPISPTKYYPGSLAFDSGYTNLYFASGGSVLRMASGQPGTVSTVTTQYYGMGNGGGGGNLPCDPSNPDFPDCQPMPGFNSLGSVAAIALNSAGSLYIADPQNNQVVRQPLPSGTATTYFGGSGSTHVPTGLAVDSSGNLYVADSGLNQVFRITPTGTQSVVAGSGQPCCGTGTGDGGPPLAAAITATNIAIDSSGRLLISGGGRVRMVSGNTITTIAGTGTPGYSGDGGPSTSAQISDGAITTFGSNIFLADYGHNVVRELTTNTAVSDLTITLTDSGPFTQGQSGALYTITVSNGGAATTSGSITVTDTLPASLTAVSAVGTGWSCTLPGGVLNCTRSDALAVGSTYPAISLIVNVATNAPATVSSQAQVAGGGETNTTNDAAGDVATVIGTASVNITASPNPASWGRTVTLTAAVTGSGPTGTVTFKDGVTVLGTVVLSSGIATLNVSNFTVGAHALTATYSGDANNAAATTLFGLNETVTQATGTLTLTTSPNPSNFGQIVTITATAPTGGTGSVQFQIDGNPVGAVTLVGGSAVTTISTLTVGTHSIAASWAGDTNYTSASSASTTQTVNQSISTTGLTSSANPSTFGQSVTFTANVVPPNATGTVTFKDGAFTLGTGTLSGGTVTVSTSALSVAAHSITAVYSGDANDASSTSTVLSQTVNQANTTVALTSSANPSAFGQSVTFTANVSPASATGLMTFRDGATTVASGPVIGGTAAFPVSILNVGTHSITAVYAGDTNDAGGTSPVLTQTVNPGSTTTVVTSSANPATSGQSVTFTATVVPSTATGSVNIKDGAVSLGTGTLSGGVVTLSTATLSTGVHTITAVYSGDTSDSSSTSSVLTQTISPASQAITFLTAPPGMLVSVDGGGMQTSPFTSTLPTGSHTITVTSLESFAAGTQYVFTGWNDAGAASHSITVGATPATYTATFKTQYQLTTAPSPAIGGTVTSGGYFDSGSVVALTAIANSGYQFASFSGALAGTANPQNITMTAPATVVANFTPIAPNLAANVGARTDGVPGVTRLVNLTLTNTGPGAATNATISNITAIADVAGSGAVTVASGAPADIGAINPGASGNTTITFNWPATATRVRFTVNFTADGGYSGSSTITTLR